MIQAHVGDDDDSTPDRTDSEELGPSGFRLLAVGSA